MWFYWMQGGRGYARDIHFERFLFHDTINPIIIDQFYCDHRHCTTSVYNCSHVSRDWISFLICSKIVWVLDAEMGCGDQQRELQNDGGKLWEAKRGGVEVQRGGGVQRYRGGGLAHCHRGGDAADLPLRQRLRNISRPPLPSNIMFQPHLNSTPNFIFFNYTLLICYNYSLFLTSLTYLRSSQLDCSPTFNFLLTLLH